MRGDSIFMQNTALASFGPQPKSLEWVFKSPDIALGGGFPDSQYLAILAVTVGAVRRPEAGWHRQPGRILCGTHRIRESELT